MNEEELDELASQLAAHPAVIEKATISKAYSPASEVSGDIKLGDDCAAIPNPNGSGYLLFASEGMIRSFVEEDPWFSGYSAVMVNLSDVAAMGGIPTAITNVIWRGPQHQEMVDAIWNGMREASRAYNVPIVGGHTTHLSPNEENVHLAASVVGYAGKNLLTSFEAEPGDQIVSVIDMRGSYRHDKPFWNASTTTSPEDLQENLKLPALIANKGLCVSAKDISNGGIIGTLFMLMNSSKVGAVIDLERLVRPPEISWLKWLTSFPSYGYIFAIKERHIREFKQIFSEAGLTVSVFGEYTIKPRLVLKSNTHFSEVSLNHI